MNLKFNTNDEVIVDLQLAAGFIALCIGVIGVTGIIIKIILKKFQDLFDTDDEGYF